MHRSLPAVALLAAAASVASADSITLTGVVRDFTADGRDFEGDITGLRSGLVSPTLGPSGVPTLNLAPGGWTPGAGSIASHESFARWFDPAAEFNMEHRITLTETAAGSGILTFRDSDFFPADGQLLGNEGRAHNYHFTFELRTAFIYEPGQFITAGGDDDIWIYVDNRLALDLGGVHPRRTGTVSLDDLGLTPGDTYTFALFFAERHSSRSELWLDTNIRLVQQVPTPVAAALSAPVLALLATRRRRRGPAVTARSARAG